MSSLSVLLLLFFINTPCDADLPFCATGVTCPTGGIWSEWATTTKNCSTSCGSCSKMLYTRTCLSTSVNCTCSGDAYKYTLCNTQTCLYPSQKSCCEPYLPMVLNGSYQCGPIPKDTSSPTTPCCPIGGLWSQWSGYARNPSESWYRTRQCISAPLNCSCTGDSVQTLTSSCPCASLISATDTSMTDCFGYMGYSWYHINEVAVDTENCYLSGIIKSNNLGEDWPCWYNNTYSYKQMYMPLVYLKGVDSTCSWDRPFDCDSRLEVSASQLTMNISFSCDPNIPAWRYDFSGYPSTGYAEMQLTYKGAPNT